MLYPNAFILGSPIVLESNSQPNMLEIASAARSTPTPRFDFFFDCREGSRGPQIHSV